MCDPFLRYGSAQAAGLKQLGLNVTLYYVDRPHEFGDNEAERALILDYALKAGVALVPLPRRRISSLVKDTLWLHRDLRRRRIATAVVQSHFDPRYATLGFALPVCLILHDPQPHSGDTLSTLPPPVRLVARISELTSRGLVIHSQRLSGQLRPILRRLPLGIVPHGTRMASGPASIPTQRRLFIFGRLLAYKGVDTALEAFLSLPEQMADVKLVIAGRGPLAGLARGQRNVELYEGYVADSDLEILLEDARLVLLPYKDATQSGVGMQAIARGLPCIVSCEGALPELVPQSLKGLVVPADNPKRLAEALIQHIDHDDTLRREVYDHAATHFDWPVAARRLYSELRRLGFRTDASLLDRSTQALSAPS